MEKYFHAMEKIFHTVENSMTPKTQQAVGRGAGPTDGSSRQGAGGEGIMRAFWLFMWKG